MGLEEQIKPLIGRKCGGEKAPEGLRQRLVMQIRKTGVVEEWDVSAD